MSRVPFDIERLLYLSEAACDECISENELTELHTVLLTDDAACRCYLDYSRLRVALRMELRAHQATRNVRQQINNKAVLPDSSGFYLMQVESPLPGPLGLLSTTIRGTLGYFSHEIPFSFLIGAIFTGLLVLVAWLVPVSNLKEHAKNSPPITSVNQRHFTSDPKMEIVGKITGMVDVKWSDINTSTETGNSVPLGRKYALSSGLMEITYNTGAKVILQGPVTYEVESAASGYLSIGKLTAKLEQKPETANQKSEIRNQKLFAIKTPTATVTDLGTEFGVEVSKEGNTISHVFRGKVEVQPAVRDGQPSETIQLCENQTVRVEKQSNGERLTMRRIAIDPAAFINAEQLLKLMEERKQTPLRQWQAHSKKLRCDSSLVAYYTFEQHSLSLATLPNQSKLGRLLDGQIENAEWVDGRIPGKPALYFHGPGSSSRVVIPHNDCFNFTGPFSVAVCFRSVRFSGYWQALIGKGENSWRLMQNLNGHNLTFDTDRYADGPAGPHTLVVVGQTIGNTTVDDNRWHWAVAVYEPMDNIAKKRLYIDGRIDVENESALPRRLNNEPVYLGTVNTKSGPEFQGMIDEVAIFSRALSAGEIAAMFQVSNSANSPKKKRGM